MSKGEWLVLSSANYFLEDAKDLCEIQGWYFQYKGINSVSLKLLLALNNWEHWRKGDQLNHLEIKNISGTKIDYLGVKAADAVDFRGNNMTNFDSLEKILPIIKNCEEGSDIRKYLKAEVKSSDFKRFN